MPMGFQSQSHLIDAELLFLRHQDRDQSFQRGGVSPAHLEKEIAERRDWLTASRSSRRMMRLRSAGDPLNQELADRLQDIRMAT